MNGLITYNNQSATIALPHNKYVDRVLGSNSFEELWWRFKGADSPSKEISESYAAFSNLKKQCIIKDYSWLHIGDGAYTRTAAIFTFFSKTKNYSVDPLINEERFHLWREKYDVQNIHISKTKFENFEHDFKSPYGITCVHAHVDLEDVDKKFPDWAFLYTNACCFPTKQMFSQKYMLENKIIKMIDKYDLGITGHERRIVVYKNTRFRDKNGNIIYL